MAVSGIRLGRIFGIPIYLHPSWFIIFALMTLSLAAQFAAEHGHWTLAQRWIVASITSVFFFASVVFHELSHSLVAQHYKINVVSITLFVFGGIARIGREPRRAIQEFNIAIAGPLASYFLAALFWTGSRIFAGNEMLWALCHWLGPINFMLATFNLIPGFPLDGGRIFRAIVWGVTGSFHRATNWALLSGQGFAYLMILGGVWRGVSGNVVGGLWLAFLGWFLLTAAQESQAQVAIRHNLAGLRAADVMSHEIPVFGRENSLDDYAHALLRSGQRCHLVTAGEKPVGLINVHSLNRFPREQWPGTSVQAAMIPLDDVHSARPEESLLSVLERMQTADINQMPVISDGHIVGIVSRDSILRVIQTRLELARLSA